MLRYLDEMFVMF